MIDGVGDSGTAEVRSLASRFDLLKPHSEGGLVAWVVALAFSRDIVSSIPTGLLPLVRRDHRKHSCLWEQRHGPTRPDRIPEHLCRRSSHDAQEWLLSADPTSANRVCLNLLAARRRISIVDSDRWRDTRDRVSSTLVRPYPPLKPSRAQHSRIETWS